MAKVVYITTLCQVAYFMARFRHLLKGLMTVMKCFKIADIQTADLHTTKC